MTDRPKRIKYTDQRFVNRLYRLHREELNKNKYDFKKGGQYFEYLNKVESHLRRIKHTIETLGLIRVLIAEKHPLSKVTTTSTISKGEFLRYNIENYFLRISTYKDQVFQLIDCVLELNIKKGIGFQNRLEKKAKEDNIGFVKDIIDNLSTLFTNVKPVRDKIAHQGYFHDSDLGLIEAGYDIVESEPEIKDLTREDMDNILSVFISKNIIEMRRIEDDLSDNLFSILDILFVDFERKIEERKNKNAP
jgi:hypothetical protein